MLGLSGKSVHRGVKAYFFMFSSLMTKVGLETSAVQLFETSRFCNRASYFHSHLPNGQSPARQVVLQLIKKISKPRFAQGKQTSRADCSKVELN